MYSLDNETIVFHESKNCVEANTFSMYGKDKSKTHRLVEKYK